MPKTQQPNPPSALDRPRFGGDPVAFLTGFLTMMRDPDWARIGFDHEDLQWCADVWEQAAIVSKGDPDFLHEQRRYQKLCNDLKQGIHERGGEVGIVLLDSADDWPAARTIIRAARILAAAEVRGIH